MAACLWCQAELQVATAVCPSCGKRQADHPSLPGLDLPVRPSTSGSSARPSADHPSGGKRSARAPAAVELAAMPLPVSGGGAMFDLGDFSFPEDGPALETELDGARAKALSVAPPPPPRSMAPRPAAAPDPQQTSALAAFGDVPDAWWGPAVYVYRIKVRQAELGRLLAERRGLASRAEGSLADAFVAFAETIRPAARKLAHYGQALRDVEEAEQRLRREDSALAAAMDAHAAKLAQFDERIAPLQKELEAAKAAVSQVQSVHARAEAMHKRAEIEARNAAAMPKGSSAEGAAREQLARATAAFVDATDRLTAARRKATATQERLLDHKNARAAADVEFKRGGEARSRGVGDARKRYVAAVAELADKAFADTQAFGAEHDDTRKEIVGLRDAKEARGLDVTVCELAMRSYDAEAYKRGVTLVAAGAGAVFLLLVIAFYGVALSGGGGGAPPSVAAPDTVSSG